MDRRRFLGVSVTATVIGLAGCSGPDDDGDDGGGGGYALGEPEQSAAQNGS